MCPKSSDVCRVTISEVGVHEYDCWEVVAATYHVVIEQCLRDPIVNDFNSYQCCNNTDGCNEFLDPPLPFQLRTITTGQDPTTTPITPTAEPRSGTGMELRHDQSIPHIPV